jgi:hypothetical protein
MKLGRGGDLAGVGSLSSCLILLWWALQVEQFLLEALDAVREEIKQSRKEYLKVAPLGWRAGLGNVGGGAARACNESPRCASGGARHVWDVASHWGDQVKVCLRRSPTYVWWLGGTHSSLLPYGQNAAVGISGCRGTSGRHPSDPHPGWPGRPLRLYLAPPCSFLHECLVRGCSATGDDVGTAGEGIGISLCQDQWRQFRTAKVRAPRGQQIHSLQHPARKNRKEP